MARQGRRPGPTETREGILAAAREMFAERGYDRATIRGIAAGAGVDAALVHHFFGTKEQVFAAAMRLPIDPAEFVPRLLALPRERFGEHLVRLFLQVWEDPNGRASFVALLRSAMTNEPAAAMFREFITAGVLGRVAGPLGIPRLRIEAMMGQLMGVLQLRYVIGMEPMASAPVEEIVALVGPALQRYLDP